MKSLNKSFLLGFFLINACYVFGQSGHSISDSTIQISKSKKLIYIENYIERFRSDKELYDVLKRVELWDTSGVVPVIDPITIQANRRPMEMEETKFNSPIRTDQPILKEK
jgi:hypothetical protein